jgi:hypothetical protein
MANRTQARGTSTKPHDTSTLWWLLGGAVGVTAIIIGISALTHSSAGEPSESLIAENTRSVAPAKSSTPNKQSRTKRIVQRPAAVQPPASGQLNPPAQDTGEAPSPAEPPRSAMEEYFYDLMVHHADRDDYVQGLMDSEVIWEGYIRGVQPRQQGTTLLLVAVPSDSSFDIAYIDFPEGFEATISALAIMDKVRITGRYQGGGPMPHVTGASVELVEEE